MRRWLLPVLLLALVLRVAGVGHGLPSIYYPDETRLVHVAVKFGATRSLKPVSFMYPPFLSYLLAPLYAAHYVSGRISGRYASPEDFAVEFINTPTVFYLLGRLLTVGFALATVLLLYRMGRLLYGGAAGLWAALFLSVSPLHVYFSQLVMPEVPLAFAVLLCLYLCIRVAERGGVGDSLAVGAVFGAALMIKYTALLLAFPLLFSHLLAFQKGLGVRRALGRMGLAGLGTLAGVFLSSPFTLIAFGDFWVDFHFQMFEYPRWGANFFDSARGYLKLLFANYELGAGVALLSLVGLFAEMVRCRARGLLMGTFVIIIFAAMSRSAVYARYMLPALPVLCLFAGCALRGIRDRLLPPGRAADVALTVSGLLLAFGPCRASVRQDLRRVRPDTRTLARRWVEENIPAGTKILLNSHMVDLKPDETTLRLEYGRLREGLREAPRTAAAGYDLERSMEWKLKAARRYRGPRYAIERVRYPWFQTGEDDEAERTFSASFADGALLRPFGEYVERGVRCAVIYEEEKFLSPQWRMSWPSYVRFYEELRRRGRMVKGFPRAPRRDGGEVKIYALPTEEPVP